MTTEIAVRDGQGSWSLAPRSLPEAMEFARLMASSDMVPRDYRGKPANVLLAVQMGADVGLSPMQAIQSIAVINGRPALWGDALLAIVQAHPHCEGVEEDYDTETDTATCVVRRRGRRPVVRTWTPEDARRAQLWGKAGPWTQYPQRMLSMRARSWACRDAFPDALRGLASAEEVSDYTIDARTGQQTERPDMGRVVDVEAEPVDYAAELREIIAAIEACETAEDLARVKPRILAIPRDRPERQTAIDAGVAQTNVLQARKAAKEEFAGAEDRGADGVTQVIRPALSADEAAELADAADDCQPPDARISENRG